MAITTSLKRSYVIQRVVLAFLCVLLGAWGAMDFFVWIPEKQQAFARAEVYRAVNDAITAHSTGAETAASSMETARAALRDAAASVREVASAAIDPDAAESLSEDEAAERMRGALEGANLEQWIVELSMLDRALQETARTPAGAEAQRTDLFLATVEMLKVRLSETDDLSAVSSVDRITKGALFMPCLPYGVWLFISLARMRRVRYTLEDDGTLRTPGGDVARDQIADIDMSRWMAKSFATVKLGDGREIKIDDFFHQDAHRIIGVLAHERYPDAWNDDATPVKPEEESDVDDEPAATEPSADDATASAAGPDADAETPLRESS